MAAVSLKGYNPIKGKEFLFDANIWLPLCWPEWNKGHHEQTKILSLFLDKCIRAKCKILLPAVIVSEIINRIYRDEWDSYGKMHGEIKYKEFRKTEDAKNITTDIQQVFISQLIKLQEQGIVEKVEDNFSEFNISQAIQNLNQRDFNDSIILQICESHDVCLVTDDSDLLKASDTITILTALY